MYRLLFVPAFAMVVFTSDAREKVRNSEPEKILQKNIFPNFKKNINALNDTVPFSFIRKNRDNVTRYYISGTFFTDNKSVSFSFSDSLIINYHRCSFSNGNHITYSDQGISVDSFLITYDSTQIAISNIDSISAWPIKIDVRNMDIRDLMGIISKDTLLTAGVLNAAFVIKSFDRWPTAFTGNAAVKNLALLQQPLGDLQFDAQMQDENTIHTNLHLSGVDNDINAEGDFCLDDKSQQLEALLNIKQLQASALKGLMNANVNLMSGAVNGVIALKGKLRHPEWSGALNFDSTKFILNQFGTGYLADRQKVKLDYPIIAFKDFTLKDSLDNSLIINGNISSAGIKNYDLNLNVKSHDFSLINTSRAINNQVYGYAGADASLAITGTSAKPIFEGDVLLNQKTAITIVLPEKNTDEDASRSVVKFIDRDTFFLTGNESFRNAPAADTGFAKFLNNKLSIRTDRQAALTIVIDPSTNDQLTIKGLSKLNAGITSGKNMVMAGNYQIDSGYYELNYQFLRPRFNILQGSFINFAGSMRDAQINIRAEYLTKTEAKNLLGNEIGVIDPKISKSLIEKIPFRVVLSLKGTLKNPVIAFNIELPETDVISRQLRTTIQNKLIQLRADVAATNKQVFALLVLDRFVGEQSTDFFMGNGSNFSDVSRESVSKFLSSSLDQIASDLFKGINVDLNLNSYKDFTSNDGAQKTDLNLDVSKNFLNDRLTVAVGKNFGIESRDASTKASQQKASRFLPDVTVNYKLSGDGKYMFRSYKKNPLEVVLDGYVVETGLSFVVTMDYEKFRELQDLMKTKSKNPAK